MSRSSSSRLASPWRASRERSRPNRKAAGTVIIARSWSHNSGLTDDAGSGDSERSTVTRSLTSTAANSSSANAPAMLGSMARRRGRDAPVQRTASTVAVASAANAASARWVLSMASAIAVSGKIASTLPGCSQNSIQIGCMTTSGSANAPTSSQSALDRMRPPVRIVSNSGTNARIHKSVVRKASVWTTGTST